MRKIFSLVSVLLTGFLAVGCSSFNKELDELPVQDVYNKGQMYLQEGDYNSAIRYLESVDGRTSNSLAYGEQTQLGLIYAQYKVGEYYKALDVAERFARSYPHSVHMDYVYYLAGLSNVRLGDNFIQDFFRINRASRAVDSVRNAFGNFQTLTQKYPNSQYSADAQEWMGYLVNRLAEHEFEIVKFYHEREAYVAVANRVEGMMRNYPTSKATNDALPYLKQALEQIGISSSVERTASLIDANSSKEFFVPGKPAYSELF